jgi:DNA end-binding protein Ku
LISIPVKLYPSTGTKSIAFNFLHSKCGARIKRQHFCSVCNQVLERSEIVRGFEFSKDQYVRFTEEELKTLEEQVTRVIDLNEFVPLSQVDPVYFDKGYYLGPDKGGEKAYQLLADAMERSRRVALAQFVMRGKSHLVLIRSLKGGLMLHTMYYADEVRDFSEVDKGQPVRVREGEMNLAVRLIEELSSTDFQPEKYHDSYRTKVLEMVDQKVEGKEITPVAPETQRGQVIDLMEALKQSLERKLAAVVKAAVETGGRAHDPSQRSPSPRAGVPPEAVGTLTFGEFEAAFKEGGLEVHERELRRSYGGLTSLKEKSKLSWAETRTKLAHLQRDLKIASSQNQLLPGKEKKVKAARIPLTARDWSRY